MTAQEIRTALLNDINSWVTPAQFGKKPKSLHVVIIDDDEDMLEVARQMALLAHFPSFDENNPNTRTRISILGKAEDATRMNEVFGNLLTVQQGDKANSWIEVPLDVQVEYVVLDIDKKSVVKDWVDAHRDKTKYHLVEWNKAGINAAFQRTTTELPGIQNREELAKRASSIYTAAQTFEIIRAEDIKNVAEFETPIQIFLKKTPAEVEKCWLDLKDIRLEESNRCLADSIYVRWRSLEHIREIEKPLDKNKDKNKKEKSIFEVLQAHLAEMSHSEHARWNVEKLIHGYRPYTNLEVIADENLSGAARTAQINYLKKTASILAHIDLCSYSRLRRIDLESIKYDSFLLLAMVKYWEKNNLSF